jgi:sortase A
MQVSLRRFYAAVLITAAIFSILVALSALWIPIKAEAAQVLIKLSWQRTLTGDLDAKPWPWADTRTVGVLQVQHLQVEQFILEGNSGRNLAFGPVVEAGSLPGNDRVLSGHRDTHFSFLEKLQSGDRIQIETINGIDHYVVTHVDIVNGREQELVIEPLIKRLSLVTCYPFTSTLAGGPLRYVVTALPLADEHSG